MAPRGKTVQLHSMFVADFETTDTDHVYKILDDDDKTTIYYQRVWLAGHKNLETGETKLFHNIDDFMLDILARGDNTNREYAFHNLKFDGSYIVPWLLNNNFDVSIGKPQPGQFSILVDDRNNWYSMNIQVTKRRKITIWDSAKLFPTALEYMPDIYATPTHKIVEDDDFYTKERPEGYEPDERDLRYFENDLQVPFETLNKHIELYGLRFKKTQASQSFYNFTQGFKAWKWRFPPLTNDQDALIRPAYWGGISYTPHDKAGNDVYNVGSYDINSSYPHKAAEKRLPYGECEHEFGQGKHPLMNKFWVAEALVRFEIKDNKLPCIPKKAISEGDIIEEMEGSTDKWLLSSEGIARMSFSCIDYETIQQSYDFEVISWEWSLHWAWKVQKEVARFVYKNNDNKVKYRKLSKQETDHQKQVEYATLANRAKIDNNSFYGKFGEDIIKHGKTPYLEDDGDIIWEIDRHEEQGERARKYLPVAIAITAWGRQQLVEMANLLGEHFLYCDTDSIHYQLEGGDERIQEAIEQGLFEVDGTKLGAWDFEGRYTRGRYLRAKCYMEETPQGERLATVAGLPADPHTGQFSKSRSCLTWDNFYIGHVVPVDQANKLRTVRTPTGSKLLSTGFKIKATDNALH